MCKMNFQPIYENSCPCGTCSEYLNSCKPIVINSFIFGECDSCYCEFCSYYIDCAIADVHEKYT